MYYFKDSAEKAEKAVPVLRDTVLLFSHRLLLAPTLIAEALSRLGFTTILINSFRG